MSNPSTENQANYGKSTEWNSMQPLKRMRSLYILIQKTLLKLQDILINEKEYSIESWVQYMIPAFWDGNSKLFMVFTTGEKDCRKQTKDFHFFFYLSLMIEFLTSSFFWFCCFKLPGMWSETWTLFLFIFLLVYVA